MANPPSSASPDSRRDGQPAGLWVLFITEMWERFSYYGMRALLVLYLTTSTSEFLAAGQANVNPGFGWSDERASVLYGIYTAAVYLTPLLGGWLADRMLGTHRSMIIGGWIIAAGHVTLACTEFFGITAGKAVTLGTAPGALVCFLTGLLLIVVGTGFFKPCVSVMVGQLYRQNDPRRDSGFTIFYMGINLGAFFSPLVAGTLGETVGWHWGFGSAAVGMLAGLFFYQMFRPKYLTGIGLPPQADPQSESDPDPDIPDAVSELNRSGPLTSIEWQRLAVILILAFVGNVFFWTAFEQAGSSMNLFAKDNTFRPLWLPEAFRMFCREEGYPAAWWMVAAAGGVLITPLVFVASLRRRRRFLPIVASLLTALVGCGIIALAVAKHFGKLSDLGQAEQFPATWYQSVNPLTILLFAPLFSWLWVRLDRWRWNPSTPMKFALGLYLLGLSFLAMVFGAFEARGGALAGPQWLLITYVVVTWGELCLSPVGLSMVTRLAPARLQSLMMGVWFLSFSLSNLLAGLVAAYSGRLASGEETFVFRGLPGFYLMLVVFPIGAGLFITLLVPVLKRMMHGAQ